MSDLSDIQQRVDDTVNQASKRLAEANRRIWENPELAYEEHIAHDTLSQILEENGYEVTRHANGLETSFEGRFGSGGREMIFCAEYDALPDIGHACGHNLIGIASLTAFLASAAVLKMTNQPGRIRIIGTPAEEHGGGKLDLLHAGAFEGANVALMSHPMPHHYYYDTHGAVGAAGARLVAKQSKIAHYRGRTAHPAANPWDGANALDAVVSGYNNQCRAPKINDLHNLADRLCSCLQAGALATGCELDLQNESAYSDILINDTLCALYQGHMAHHGQNVLKTDPNYLQASTDFGDVSYALPGIHAMFCIPVREKGVVTHHVSFTEAAGTDEAFKLCLTVGKSLALCAWDLLQDDAKYDTVVSDWKAAKAESI